MATQFVPLLTVFLLALVFQSKSAPVAFATWPLNAKNGLLDNSGNKLDGKFNSPTSQTPTFALGPDFHNQGSVVVGPGDDDYIKFNSTQLTFARSDSWTIAVFVKATHGGPIIEFSNNGRYGLQIWANWPAADFLFFEPTYVTSSKHYFPCTMSFTWQFIAITYNAAIGEYGWFCQDHFVAAVSNLSQADTGIGFFTLGKRLGRSLDGRVSQFSCLSMFKGALTAKDLCQVKWSKCLQSYTAAAADLCSPDLLAYWPLAEWSQLRDFSGNNLNGHYNSTSQSANFTATGPSGFPNSALQLGPNNDDFPYFSSPSFSMGNQSWSVALYFHSIGNVSSPIFEYYRMPSSGNNGFQLWANEFMKEMVYLNPVSSSDGRRNISCKFSEGWKFISVSYDAVKRQYALLCFNRIAHNSGVVDDAGPAATSTGYFALGKRFNSSVSRAEVACLTILKNTINIFQQCDVRWRVCAGLSRLQVNEMICLPGKIGDYPLTALTWLADQAGYNLGASMDDLKTVPRFDSGPTGAPNGSLAIGPGDADYLQLYYPINAFNNNTVKTFAIIMFFNAMGEQQPILTYNKVDGTCCGLKVLANYPAKNILYVDPGTGVAPIQVECQLSCWQFIAINYDDNLTFNIYCGYNAVKSFPNFQEPETSSGQMNIGKEMGKATMTGLVSCLKIYLTVEHWSNAITYWRDTCSNGVDPSLSCITSTTAIMPPTTTPTTMPATNGSNNLVTDPVETIQKFYFTDVEQETSIPLLTAEELLQNCSDFSASRIAPPNNGVPTTLLTAFAIDRLVDFDDVSEVITVDAVFFLHWQVKTCQKDGLEALFKEKPWAKPTGKHRLFVATKEEIWVPRYFFLTSANDIYMNKNTFGDDLTAFVSPNLDINAMPNQTLDFFFLRRGFFEAKCPLNLANFPFDSVTCEFSFSLERSIEQVLFDDVYVLCPAERQSTQWAFDSCDQIPKASMRFDATNVSVVTFTATLSRNPGYFVVNLALPNFAFGLLQLTSYLIPAERPERPIFAVSTLLSLAVGQSTLIRGMPRTSEKVLLSDYMTGLMWICGLITLYHLSANWVTYSGSGHVKKSQKDRSWVTKIEVVSVCLACASFIALHSYVIAVFVKSI